MNAFIHQFRGHLARHGVTMSDLLADIMSGAVDPDDETYEPIKSAALINVLSSIGADVATGGVSSTVSFEEYLRKSIQNVVLWGESQKPVIEVLIEKAEYGIGTMLAMATKGVACDVFFMSMAIMNMIETRDGCETCVTHRNTSDCKYALVYSSARSYYLGDTDAAEYGEAIARFRTRLKMEDDAISLMRSIGSQQSPPDISKLN